jgi:hypothetical protein
MAPMKVGMQLTGSPSRTIYERNQPTKYLFIFLSKMRVKNNVAKTILIILNLSMRRSSWTQTNEKNRIKKSQTNK